LIVPDGKPRPAASYQVTVDAGRMDQRDNRGVFDEAQAAALEVVDLEAEQLSEEE
jgi:hypothetical protein